MDADVLSFFDEHMDSLAFYEAFESSVRKEIKDVQIKVQKTQISFSNKRNFAFASLLPVRKAKERPEAYLTVTFGLSYPVDSPRVDAATEAYPNRWTHHVMVGALEELDEELMGWVKAAAEFSAGKR